MEIWLADHLWLYGPAGCGKTILASTIIEDIRKHHNKIPGTICCMFYFTFSDERKQTYMDLLRSTLYQLSCEPMGRGLLLEMIDKPDSPGPTLSVLESALVSSCERYRQVILVLDALDECPGDCDTREALLDSLLAMAIKVPNLKILATSRELADIKQSMVLLKATPIFVAKKETNTDIRKYITTQLISDRRLSKLDPATQEIVLKAICEKADGMYDAD